MNAVRFQSNSLPFAFVVAAWLSGTCLCSAIQQGTAPLTAETDKTFWELYRQGGFMMWVMLVVSMFALSLIIESAVRLRAKVVVPSEQFDALKLLLALGNYQEAWREALEEHAHKEALMMRTRINYLSVIGVVSPMLGLIGTVVGMIKAFDRISAISYRPEGLSEAIGEVLVATAFGLFIAVPAFFAYYFFRNRAQVMIVLLQDKVTRLMRRVPYEELQGIQVGPELEAELAVASPVVVPGVSCPNCSRPIAHGSTHCNACGVTLQWS